MTACNYVHAEFRPHCISPPLITRGITYTIVERNYDELSATYVCNFIHKFYKLIITG